jgi:hypothetical protein
LGPQYEEDAMYPHLTEALAQQRIADMRREAAARGLAAAASEAGRLPVAGTLARRAARLLASRSRRRYRQIELTWPDGVCSVVPARSDDRQAPMADSRQ